uniref:G-patch domain-containing protein n=1 Tax=Parastrongyloides trichosuri TaxID=131310 RepID=A0A0N4ZPA2_PARTI
MKGLYDDSESEDEMVVIELKTKPEESKEKSSQLKKTSLFVPQQIHLANKRPASNKRVTIPPKSVSLQEFSNQKNVNDNIFEKNKEIKKKVDNFVKKQLFNFQQEDIEEKITYFMGSPIINEYDPFKYNDYDEIVKIRAQKKLEEIERAQSSVPEVKKTISIKSINETNELNEDKGSLLKQQQPSQTQKLSGMESALRYIHSKGHTPGTGLGKYNQGTTESLKIVTTKDGKQVLM